MMLGNAGQNIIYSTLSLPPPATMPMAALGQKRTFTGQSPMSALPQKRTWISTFVMSALCQKRTHAPQQNLSLFDDLVGAREQCARDGEAKRLRGLKIDHKVKLGRLLDRNVGWLRAAQNLV